MKTLKSRTTAISVILIASIALSLFAFPVANAAYDSATQAAISAGMNWTLTDYNASALRLLMWNRYGDHIPTQVYMVMSPNPVGVGQQVSFILFMPQQPRGANAFGVGGDVRYQYTVDVNKPDGTKQTLGPIQSDSTGTAYTLWTPAAVGSYNITVNFLQLLYQWSETSDMRDYHGVTYDGASYTKTLVVQEEYVYPTGWEDTPLPNEYWVRPIEGTNTGWYQVASNWLSGPKDRDNGGTGNQYQQDGIAPNSGHILWTKVTEDGGLVGGGNFSVPGEVFNAGHQYQTRFTNPIIMGGRLYYEIPIQWAGGGGGWVCVDLRTGETIWQDMRMGTSGVPAPAFGYYYDLDDMNNHGVVTPGWLFSSNFAQSIHPRYGIIGTLNLTDTPRPVVSQMQLLDTSVVEIVGPKGESLRYQLDQNGWLAQWNSTRVFDDAESGKIPANCPITPARPGNTYWNGSTWVSNTVRQQQGYASVTTPAYDWNVSAPWRVGMTGGSTTIRAAIYNDILFGTNGSHPVGTSAPRFDYPTPVTIWAVSLKLGTQGQLLYMKNIDTIPTPPDGGEIMLERVGEGVAVFVKLFERKWIGYDIYTGNKLWETDPPEAEFNPFGYYSFPSLIHTESVTIAEGKLFTGGYTGAVFCYDLKTGKLLWRYEDYTGRTVFPYFTLMLGPVADGKLYVGTHEHSADTPLFKGNKVRCLNVTTGEEIWAMYGWAHPYTFAVADGTLIYWNNYDHQVYAVAKGPTAMTVDAPKAAITMGSSLVITGTVTDISAGTKQAEQALRFPNGVPAVSDESMNKWMEYVYMQKSRPANATGVEVTLDTIDPNGNFVHIGTATSDASGSFSYMWQPEIPGKYTVIATFAGSEAYYSSFAETAIGVQEAPPEPAAPEPAPPLPPYETYTIGTGIAIIAAVAIVGLMLLRKKP
ncbi:PQQ-binding-like beta-propeller repeat protein [Candidatus Bathyarchaeota archaeon]|nr:PQQ-binding-like beta-propeller repeat protein [Candidatus Bathyarchaeota archaeon]